MNVLDDLPRNIARKFKQIKEITDSENRAVVLNNFSPMKYKSRNINEPVSHSVDPLMIQKISKAMKKVNSINGKSSNEQEMYSTLEDFYIK